MVLLPPFLTILRLWNYVLHYIYRWRCPQPTATSSTTGRTRAGGCSSHSNICLLRRNGVAQPDDREHRQGGEEEACMAVLNNFYGDGEDIEWVGAGLNYNPRRHVKSITETAQGWSNFLCKFWHQHSKLTDTGAEYSLLNLTFAVWWGPGTSGIPPYHSVDCECLCLSVHRNSCSRLQINNILLPTKFDIQLIFK